MLILCFHFIGGFLRRSAPINPQPARGIHQPSTIFAHSSELGLANLVKVCGETGIRTPETLLEFTRFPGVPLQPLEHLSNRTFCAVLFIIGYKGTAFLRHTQVFRHFFANFNHFMPKSCFALRVVTSIMACGVVQ